jgi:DNA-binding transcriptional MerR regulator
MSNSLEHLKGIEYHGVRELADAAERVLRSAGTSQEKGTVAEYPNERTVRYYITEGLLDQAIKKSGVTSVFGYEHLLTLLTIKKLQSDGLPISVIKTLIEDKTVEELEKLLGEEVHVFTKRSDLDAYRQSTSHTDDSEVMVFPEVSFAATAAPPATKKNEAKEYLESLLLDRSREKEPPAVAKPKRTISRGSTDWRRYEIVPGMELHVARAYRPPTDAGFRQRILVLIDGILHSRERRQK